MPLTVDHHFDVYRNPHFYCGPGPGVVVTGDGTLIVSFRRVPSWLSEGHSGHWHPATESCLTRSADGGQTWTDPQVFLAGYQCPCLARLRDGTLIHSTHRMELVPEELFEQCTQGQERPGARRLPWPGIHGGTAVWRSEDEGVTWGSPVSLSGVPGVEPVHASLPQPVAVRGNVVETAAGRLLISAYTLGSPNEAHLFGSDDGGRTWEWLSLIGADLNEAFLYETESAALMAYMRRNSDATYLCAARSEDGGAQWTAAEDVCRGYPACVQRLPSGRALLAYGYRFPEGHGVRARLLSAEGELLESEEECVIRDDGAVADLGYPDAALLPDGRAVVVYYTNRRDDVADGEPSRAPRFIGGCILGEG